MRILLSCVLVAVSATAAEPSEKKAWEWTDEERLAERFDPIAAQYRLAVAKTDGRVGADIAAAIVVDGDRNPELFLPWELTMILAAAYSEDPEVRGKWRHAWGDGTRLLGPDLWSRLEPLLRPYVDADLDRARFQALARDASASERPRLSEEASRANRALCPARVRALAAARQAFGREVFDRFLYEVVAKGQLIRSSPPSSPHAGADLWRSVEGGCR